MPTFRSFALAPLPWLLAACASSAVPTARLQQIHQVALGDERAFAALRRDFVTNNPGYDVHYHAHCRELAPTTRDRVVFVQGPAERTTAPTVGDALLVRGSDTWRCPDDGELDLVAFTLPSALPPDLPATVRPDFDPRITDTPGGCATDGDAYRRILLTWRPEVGPYVLNLLNAHRVRITDSFTHYHPIDGGFDEFYLVQQVPQAGGARLLTSTQVAAIEARTVTAEQAKDLLQSRDLHTGDLVYLPRGTLHRGLGGALVQVIAVPGFLPLAEIGVDHHLWAIDRRLGLTGEAAIPFHRVGARTSVEK